VAEWSKALAWKVSIRQKRIEGSNPSRSATTLVFPVLSRPPGLIYGGLLGFSSAADLSCALAFIHRHGTSHGMNFAMFGLQHPQLRQGQGREGQRHRLQAGDSGQLYLYVTPAGGRHWRMNYAYGEPTNAGGRMPQKTLSRERHLPRDRHTASASGYPRSSCMVSLPAYVTRTWRQASALKKQPRATKQPSIIDGIEDQDERIAAVRAVLVNCDNERCRALMKFARRFIALTAVWPNEVHGARWDEIEGIDWGKSDAPAPAALWRIGAARMKGDEDRRADKAGDHLVPLAPEAVDLLRVVRRLSGDLPIVFPGERHAHCPMSENTLNARRSPVAGGGAQGRVAGSDDHRSHARACSEG
jgi:hypothetical protein